MGLAVWSLVMMPLLGIAKQRIAEEIGSAATKGEGRQNLLCAYLAGALLVGLAGNAIVGAWWLDPVVGLLIAGVAVKEGWRRGAATAAASAHRWTGSPSTPRPARTTAAADLQPRCCPCLRRFLPALEARSCPDWQWLLVAGAVTLVLYVAAVLGLVVAGRRSDARALAGFIPDCIVLFKRLLERPARRVVAARRCW